MKRRTLLITVPAAAALSAACGQPQSSACGEAAPLGKPVAGGTLTAAMERDATNFDPIRQSDSYSAVVMNQVLDTLYEVDKDNKVVGRLVEKTEMPQSNIYVMTLRKGVKFHDGTDLDAEAVKFNLQRHLPDPPESAGAATKPVSVRRQDVKDVETIEVTGTHSLKITLKTAYAPFLNKLVGGPGFVVSPTAIQKLGEALQRDLTGAGSGPYRFAQWQKDTQVVVERNPTYWRKDADGGALPYLDRLVFKPISNEDARLTNLRTGEVDVLIGNPPWKNVAELKCESGLTVRQIPGTGWSLIALNTTSEPFNDPAIRRAFSYAIDREQILKTVYFGFGDVLDTPVPRSLTWASESGAHPYMKQDLARAKQEMQSAWKSSVKFTLHIANNSPQILQTAELIKDQIKGVGLELEIQQVEFSTLLSLGQTGAFQSLTLGWTGDVDPDGMTSLYATGSGTNFPRYSSPETDRLLAEARSNVEQTKRGDAYKAVQKVLWQDQPMIVYWNPPQVSAVRKPVQNYPQTYNGFWGSRDFERMWKTR